MVTLVRNLGDTRELKIRPTTSASQSNRNVATILNMTIGKVSHNSLPEMQIYFRTIIRGKDIELLCVRYPTYGRYGVARCKIYPSGFRHSNVLFLRFAI